MRRNAMAVVHGKGQAQRPMYAGAFGALRSDHALRRRTRRDSEMTSAMPGDPRRVQALLESYSQRFAEEFLAVEPPREKPAS